MVQNQYMKGTAATQAIKTDVAIGFTGGDSPREDRGTRGGRGGRGGRAQQDNKPREKRQNPKQALKKTEEEFPAL